MPLEDLLLTVQRQCILVLVQARPGPADSGVAMLFGIRGLAGTGARTTWLSHALHAYFLRTRRITRTLAGMMSSRSLTSSPISVSVSPSFGQMRSLSGSSSCTTSMLR